MHAKNFYSEFLDIFKNDFRPADAYAPMSQNGFPGLKEEKITHKLNYLNSTGNFYANL
jgi:hypothetical protein